MHLLFDLDGTLTDSFPGISRSVRHAIGEVGGKSVTDEHVRPFVGAPLAQIFAGLLESDDVALLDRAAAIYRAQFDEVGILENRVFPGIPEALTAFRACGDTLHVVTARSAPSARHVLQYFSLTQYFVAVHGPEPAERMPDKADLVALALQAAGALATDAIMIGDRADDIRAAQAHGVRTVAVGWGYGSHAELSAAGADYYAPTIADLVDWIHTSRNKTES